MVTAAMKLKDACSLKEKLDSILKRDITLLTKVHLVKAIYYHPPYLIYMQSTPYEMPGWMKHKLESRLQGEILITSDLQMTLPL